MQITLSRAYMFGGVTYGPGEAVEVPDAAAHYLIGAERAGGIETPPAPDPAPDPEPAPLPAPPRRKAAVETAVEKAVETVTAPPPEPIPTTETEEPA